MLALSSSRTLTPTGERSAPALRLLAVAFLAGLLSACNAEPETKEKLPHQQPTVSSSTKPADDQGFCDGRQYPFQHLQQVDLRDVKAYFRNHPRQRLTGQRWRRLNWDRFENSPEINHDANPPDAILLYAFQYNRANYCAFLTHTLGDDYDAVDLYTLNHQTNRMHRLPVAGTEGAGIWPRREGTDTAYAAIGIMQGRFLHDTLLAVVYTYPVLSRQEYAQEKHTTFSVDSITTHFTILPDGAFRKVGYDSVRLHRTGDVWQWRKQVGIEPYGFE